MEMGGEKFTSHERMSFFMENHLPNEVILYCHMLFGVCLSKIGPILINVIELKQYNFPAISTSDLSCLQLYLYKGALYWDGYSHTARKIITGVCHLYNDIVISTLLPYFSFYFYMTFSSHNRINYPSRTCRAGLGMKKMNCCCPYTYTAVAITGRNNVYAYMLTLKQRML